MRDLIADRAAVHGGGRLQPGPHAEPFAATRYRKYRWDRESIEENAPEAPGIFGLFGALWIYIGEAANLRAEMLAKLISDDPRLARYQPSGFAFEVTARADQGRRCAELIEQLQPICQPRPRKLR
jgi:hypothetical protein